ncbi:MAG: hypothetical protein ACK41C_14225 [Phenylobacterium sp.]|uniref:hypothetical protein n=1 Tax=Phenylobacterium sp. TaxID=1871053 RepID=UPI00391D5B55
MAPRLKVFVTSDGLTDYVVATSSRPKALAAWGANQDLFKTGGARETDDPDLVEAALAEPGEVLRRPANTKGALASLAKTRPPKPKGPSKATLKRIAQLETRLAEVAERKAAAAAKLEADRAALEARHEREMARLEAEARKLRDDLAAVKRGK